MPTKSGSQSRLRAAGRIAGMAGALALAGLQPLAAQEAAPGSIATSMPYQGDPSGARKRLEDRGVTSFFNYTNDVLGNVRGGLRRGLIDQGKLEGAVAFDFEKLAGIEGLTAYVNAFQIHNTGRIRRDYVGGINTIAAIEAVPSTRLSELWLEQKFWNGNASLKVGQLTADSEFFFAASSFPFLQSDWATITATNLPSGGPAYPLSTPGARLKLDPHQNVSLLLAVFNGDPAGPGPGDEQIRNLDGLNFRVRDPALIIGEAQFRTNQGKGDTGLARTVKLGGWTHLGDFRHQHLAEDGTSLADPRGSADPAKRRGNAGVYAVLEQQLYRTSHGSADSGITAFSRVSFSPSDRNLIDFFIDGGLIANGLFASRPADKFGVSVIYSRFSNAVRAFDRDQIAFGTPGIVRDYEANIEFTYQAQVIPGWTVQPLLTYIHHPNGDASRNALVTGARSIWRY